jgi:hypothetical protein
MEQRSRTGTPPVLEKQQVSEGEPMGGRILEWVYLFAEVKRLEDGLLDKNAVETPA